MRVARLLFKRGTSGGAMAQTFSEIRGQGYKLTPACGFWDVWA